MPRRCARALPNLGRCEHCVDCDSAHPPGSCARGCHLCTRAARGGGDAPSRAPFKRCQGLIDEKCPQQVRTCLRRRRRPGSGGCFSGSAAVAGSLPQRRPPGIPGSPKARVGVEAGARREPHLLLLFHSPLLPQDLRVWRFSLDPGKRHGPVEPHQSSTATNGGSSKTLSSTCPQRTFRGVERPFYSG